MPPGPNVGPQDAHTFLELGQLHMQFQWVSLIKLLTKWEDGIRMLLKTTSVSSHSSYSIPFHCILPLDSTLSISTGVVCLYMHLRTQSRYILLLLHRVVSHYGSLELFCCPLVCIVTTYRQYRSFLLAFSPKILFLFYA